MTKLIFKEINEINEAVVKIKSDQLLIIIDQNLWNFQLISKRAPISENISES